MGGGRGEGGGRRGEGEGERGEGGAVSVKLRRSGVTGVHHCGKEFAFSLLI